MSSMKLAAVALLAAQALASPDDGGYSRREGVFSANSKFGSPEQCCEALRALAADKTIFPNNAAYQESIESYWSDQAKLSPNCLFQPASAKDVSAAVKVLVQGSCQFAVRGGGHTPAAGSNNIDNGVTIDFSKMRGVSYDTSSKFAKVQPGSRWGDVYPPLEKFGVTVVGGRAEDVGVAGLITGGGNSLFTAREGFACDNVANFEVVLADGSIVNANNQERRDLFQALKGGSSNFGIVTRFDLYTIAQDSFWGGTGVWPASTTNQHVEAFVRFEDGIKADPFGSLISIWNYDSTIGATSIIKVLHYTKTNEPNPPVFKEILAIPGVQFPSFRNDTHYNFVKELSQAADRRNLWHTTSFQKSADVFKKTLEIFDSKVAYVKDKVAGNFTIAPLYQPVPGFFAELGKKKGGNVLGLDEDRDLIWFLWNLSWDNPQDDKIFQEIGASTIEEIDAYAAERRLGEDYKYLNYANPSQNPLRSYGPQNVNKIRRVAAKYDSRRVFQYLVPGGFKISKA